MLETFPTEAADNWAIVDDGIYFIAPAQPKATSPSAVKYSIQFLDLGSAADRHVRPTSSAAGPSPSWVQHVARRQVYALHTD